MNLLPRILATLTASSVLICCAQLPQTKAAESWVFAYPDDTKPGSRLDLRYLNEKVAGETGYIRLAPDGQSFLRGDGKPIRFWAINSFAYRLKPEEMAASARFLAKMGVNLVRLHGSISPKGKGKAITDVDAEEIDRIQRYVAALKKEGIYSVISPFWANGGHSGAAASWGLGYGDGEDIWGLLFIDDRVKEAYKGWVRKLYAAPNPYTGIPLAKDPAVALAQVQNEDSLLFWTFQAIKAPYKQALRRKFGQWLKTKYGSVNAAKEKWAGATQSGDDWSNGTPAMLDTWVLTQAQTGGMKARTDDQMAFLIDLQRGFYGEMARFYRTELGYKGLTNASNWISADSVRMNDAERYTYTTTDVLAVNRYFNGGIHKGPNDGWRIDEGDFFSDRSALKDPRNLPINVKQAAGYPMLVTESGWVSPLGYQAEGPLLCAAYQSLTGMQGFFWFSMGTPSYNPNPVFDFINFSDGSHALSKWDMAVPQVLGQFPAAALMYRLGYVKQGAPVVHEERTRASLDSREIPLIAEDPSFDPNHAGGDARAGTSQAKGVDPLAYLVGRVEVKYDGDPAKSVAKDLSGYIDRSKSTVRSVTGELTLDYGQGVFRVDAPKAQAVAGFLAKSGRKFKLTDVSIESDDEYASISVVPMDDKPLAQSSRVLIQIGTVVRPTGWQQTPATMKSDDGKTTEEGFRVVHPGKMPWRVRGIQTTVTIANGGITKATALDPAGYPVAAIEVKRANGQATIRLPANAMYLIVE